MTASFYTKQIHERIPNRICVEGLTYARTEKMSRENYVGVREEELPEENITDHGTLHHEKGLNKILLILLGLNANKIYKKLISSDWLVQSAVLM